MELFDYDTAPIENGASGPGGTGHKPGSGMRQVTFNMPAGGRPAGTKARTGARRPDGGQHSAGVLQGAGGHAAGSRQQRPSGTRQTAPRPGRRSAGPRRAGIASGMPRTGSTPSGTLPPSAPPARPSGTRPRAPQHAAPARRPQRPAQPQHVRRPAPGSRPRRRRSFFGGAGFFVASFGVILVLAGVITYLLETPQRAAQAASLAAESAAAQAAEAERLQQSLAAAGDSVGPVYQANPVIIPFSASLYALPANGRVDMRYFDDALLIGDSLTMGFQVYASSLPGASFAAYSGAGPQTFLEGTVTDENGAQVQAMDVITSANAKKVYIMLGTNSMAVMQDEGFLKYYGDLLDLLQQTLPAGTVFYVESILPVSSSVSAEDEGFSAQRIQNLNEQLALMAAQRDMHYLDLYSVFAGEDGALRSEYAAEDGLHLNDEGYGQWREYLVTHAAYSAENPYLPGSPCYVAPAAQ